MSRDMQKPKQRERAIFGFLLSWNVFKRSLLIALVVGCLLSLVNQLDVILREPLSARVATKIAMNFVIPFAVASVSALVNRSSGT